MPKPYAVPGEGTIDYQYFQAPTNFTEDKWVQAIEARPGARSVVHHILVFCREPGGVMPQSAAYKQVVPQLSAAARAQAPAQATDTRRQMPGALIATTAPGTNAMIFKPGTAQRIKAGSVLTFQMHYTTNGAAASDTSSVGIIFAKQPPQLEVRSIAFANTLLRIQPGANNEAVESAIEFNEDVRIFALFPHTHLRGKSWEYRLVYPDGRKEVVLAVPKGARLEATAHYDNSVANPWNPDPKVTVRWGEQTWEEMQYSGITYATEK